MPLTHGSALALRSSSLALAILLGLYPACHALGPEEPSVVAQGRYFSTGHPSYDEIFVRLHRMQVDLEQAPDAVTSTRREIAQSLDLAPEADATAIGAALGERVSEAGSRGVEIRATRGAGPDSDPSVVGKGPLTDADKALVAVLGTAFVRLRGLDDDAERWENELEWLPSAGVELDASVDAAFVGRSRGHRDEVRQNLADAQKLVALMRERVAGVDRERTELLNAMAAPLAETAAPPPEPPAPKPAARAPARRAPAARPDTPAPEKPRPKQGPARPDFEP